MLARVEGQRVARPERLAEAPRNTILCGDVLAMLATLPDESVQMCVTSPPYWSLRDYGLPPSVWGGERECDHLWGSVYPRAIVDLAAQGLITAQAGEPEHWAHQMSQGAYCQRCGAWRGCLGLEPSPDLYVQHLVAVFREVRRVLRADGTLWLNLGDCYAGGGCGSRDPERWPKQSRNDHMPIHAKDHSGLKPKDLVGIPWMVAFALRADGWWLRMDDVWHKSNTMPESVTDRPTRSHEYVFLLSKAEHYFYDKEAVAEPVTGHTHSRGPVPRGDMPKTTQPGTGIKNNASFTAAVWNPVSKRNLRSVWTIPTSPRSETHFATFPPALVRAPILAGSSPMACEHCGAPWKRQTAHACGQCGSPVPLQAKACPECAHVRDWKKGRSISADMRATDWSTPGRGTPRLPGGFRNTNSGAAWRPTCRCENTGAGRSLVVDPFAGAGTALLVAKQAGRDYLGIELNPMYAKIGHRYIARFGRPYVKPAISATPATPTLWDGQDLEDS